MNRRHYLSGIAIGIGAFGPAGARSNAVSDHLEIDIVETNSPVEGGELLEVTADVRNGSSEVLDPEIEFLVGDDPDVARRRTGRLEPGETRTLDHLQFRTYPVRNTDEFPVRIEAGDRAAETTVEVYRVDEVDRQYAHPEPGITVEPGSTVLFEIDEAVADESQVHWFVDGEYEGHSLGPWFGTYRTTVGAEFWNHTFESEGTHEVAVALDNRDGANATTRWEITVATDGNSPPDVDGLSPMASEVPTEGDYDLELEVSSTDTDLDRIVWWETQADVIRDVSDIDGREATASVSGGGCQTCRLQAWVLDENNVRTSVTPWQFDDSAALEAATGAEASDDGVAVVILDSTDVVTGGDVLEITALLENRTDEAVTREVELVVGHDPEVLDTESVTIDAGATERVILAFETYPVEQAETFPVRVETDGAADEREVYVAGAGP